MISEKSNGQPTPKGEIVPIRPPAQAEQSGGMGTGKIVALVLGGIVVLAIAAYFIVPRFFFVHVAVVSGAGGAAGGKGGKGGNVPVVIGKAIKGDMHLYINGLGTVTALNTVTVRSRVDGELIKVNYIEGQLVKAGETLAEIDPKPYKAQLAQAQGNLDRDNALLALANSDLIRYQKLFAQTFDTEQHVATQKSLVKQYEGAIITDQGQIESATVNLDYAHITAPISGTVGLRLVDQGNIVHATDANGLVVITQIQPISVVFTIPEDDIARLLKRWKPGQETSMSVEAWDRDLKAKIADGKLLAVDNQVDPTNGMVRLKAVFANKNFELYPNLFVNARLLIETLHNAIIVPAAAIQRGPDNAIYVYVVKDGAVTIRSVKIGPTEADHTVIDSGLAAGEVVVTDGVDKLQNGTKVTPRKPNHKPTSQPATQPGQATTEPSSSAAIEPAGSGATTEPSANGGHKHHHGGAAE